MYENRGDVYDCNKFNRVARIFNSDDRLSVEDQNFKETLIHHIKGNLLYSDDWHIPVYIPSLSEDVV